MNLIIKSNSSRYFESVSQFLENVEHCGKEGFFLLFQTLTLTNGALMQVKRPLGGVALSGETHCLLGFLRFALLGGRAHRQLLDFCF